MSVSQEQRERSIIWLHKFFKAGDALDPEPWLTEFYAENAVMAQPGHPEIKGHDDIVAFMKQHFTVLDTIHHVLGRSDILPDRAYQEATVTWTVKGDPEARPIVGYGLGVFTKRVDSDKLDRFTVYLDYSALTKRVKEVQSQAAAETAEKLEHGSMVNGV